MSSYESLVESALGSGMAQLHNLSKDELQQILNDDDKLDQLIRDLPQVKSVSTEKEMLLAQNKSLAEWNLSQEPQIRQQKEKLIETYEQAQTAKNKAEEQKAELDSMSDSRSLDTTLALLQAAAQEAEDKSEEVAAAFVEGSTNSVEDFLSAFKPLREQAHLRRIKAEKLAELLRSQQYGASPAPPVSNPYSSMAQQDSRRGTKQRAPEPPQAWGYR